MKEKFELYKYSFSLSSNNVVPFKRRGMKFKETRVLFPIWSLPSVFKASFSGLNLSLIYSYNSNDNDDGNNNKENKHSTNMSKLKSS